MQGRMLLLAVAAAAAALAGWSVVHAGGPARPAALAAVGGSPIPAAALAAGADRAIERRWLEGEAAERGVPIARGIAALRGDVADAIAGPGAVPRARALAERFAAYHARWRARTTCAPQLRDPHADRCGDVPRAPTGACRWLGAATVCELADHSRLLVPPRGHGRPERFRHHGAALGKARTLYVRERRARARRAAAERARRAQDRRARGARAAADTSAGKARAAAHPARPDDPAAAAAAADPRLSPAALAAGRAACARQVAASEPYLFAFGLQDVAGQAEGLAAVRTRLAGRLRDAAASAGDREKLVPLLAAIAAGNRALDDLAAADLTGDRAAVDAGVARLDDRTAPERERSRRLGLGDCLVRPAA